MLSPKPFHLILALLAAVLLAFSGCGDDGGEEAASPLDEALGYLSEDAAFAFIVSSDLEDYDDVRQLSERFPFGGQVENLLQQALAEEGVDFEEQIEPLLGNEIVIGTDDNASFIDSEDDTPFVLAVETGDADALEELATSAGRDAGESEGYDIYQGQEDDTWLAVKDEIVVLSNSEETLNTALAQRGEDNRLTEEDVDAAFEELPGDAPLKVYVNVAALLEVDPDTQEALKVKWVESLETLGVSADVGEDEVAIDWFLRTDSSDLSDEDLPIATGSEAPQLLERAGDSAEIAVALREPAQVIDFALATLEAIDPATAAQFEAGKAGIGQRLGVDIDDDVLAQLTGDVAAVARIDGSFGTRLALEDGPAFQRTLAKIMVGLPRFADGVVVTRPKAGDRFYGVATSDGESFAVGVVGDSLVVANDPVFASDVATRDLVDAEGQEGALVAVADAEQLANAVLAQFAGGIEGLGGSLFTGPLGDLLSSTTAETDGVTGRLELKIE
ncbi:MAG TPA: DUF3352 domain-containing protein [Thermoleophilaceae bacterium]|nr:DUF3352 domain-containing protein [Thermoleophilaceae bacterium]